MEAGLKMEGSMLQVIILREFKTTCGIAGKDGSSVKKQMYDYMENARIMNEKKRHYRMNWIRW